MKASVAAVAILLIPITTLAAECKVGDEWFPYDSPQCETAPSAPDTDDSPRAGSMPGAEVARLEIESRPLVRSSAINRGDDTITLVVEVNDAMNDVTARRIGESFMRLFVSLDEEESGDPGPEIGETDFHYLIGIVDSQGNFLQRGAKVDFARNITW